jgi:PAS domain S-box-containing protein
MAAELLNTQTTVTAYDFSPSSHGGQSEFEHVFANFPDLVHSVDEDGFIVYANPVVTKLLGYELEEYIGMRIVDIYAPPYHAELAAGFKALIARGELDTVESCLISKSGEKIPVEIRSLAKYSDTGAFSKSFSIIRDMRPIIAMKEQLRSASRKAAQGQLAQYVVHDLRSPLTTLKLQAESLQTLEVDQGVSRGKLDKISRITSSAVEQIEELLKVLNRSGNAPIEKKPCDVAEALHQAVNRVYGASLAANIALETNIQINKHTILRGDDLGLRQLFGNLLNNAIAAVKKQYVGETGGVVKASLVANKNYIAVRIEDNGVGIDDAVATKIFDRGYSTLLDPEGTGLGLSICKKIVGEHDGQISLLTSKSTVFEVNLPKVPKR